MAMTLVETDTIVALRLREMCISSWKNAVLTSWSEIMDVRAASDMRA